MNVYVSLKAHIAHDCASHIGPGGIVKRPYVVCVHRSILRVIYIEYFDVTPFMRFVQRRTAEEDHGNIALKH